MTDTARVIAGPTTDRNAPVVQPQPAVGPADRPAHAPGREASRVTRPAASRGKPRWLFWAWILGIGLPLVAINVIGMPFYLAPLAVRVRDTRHEWFKPSGRIGLSAGIVAAVIFIFLWLYPLRKKYRRLAFLGSLGRWMDVHVATALALPLLLAIHSAWRADGLIGLGLLAMMVVIASGVVGRYLYVRIPRARNGVELTREEVAARRRALVGQLAEATGLAPHVIESTLAVEPLGGPVPGLLQTVVHLVSDDLLRWRRRSQLRHRWTAVAPDGHRLTGAALREAVRLASEDISLQQQARMLTATQRIFRFWHVAHRPFAITALIAVIIHVAVVIAVGAVRW